VPRAREKGLALSCFVPSALPAWILGDAGRLRQILLNLLGNAVKFTDRGEVTLRAAASGVAGGIRRLRLTVRDTGPGIPEAARAGLFQAFTQVPGEPGRPQEGTGLGLAITRRLVAAMGGQVGLESQPGAGSSFWLELPLRVSRNPAGDSGVSPGLAGLRVLVAAEGGVREVLVDYLAGLGAGVLEPLAGETPPAAARRLAAAAAGPEVVVVAADPAPEAVPLPGVRWFWITAPGARLVAAPDGYRGVLQQPLKYPALARALAPAAPDREPPEAVSPERPPAGGLRILLVEDNATNRKVAGTMLQRLGHRTEVAENGQLALEMLRRQPFDVVLMDVRMPVMDGLEASWRWRAEEPGGRRLPIVAMTAHAAAADRDRCLAAGMDDFIAKPVRMAELGQVLTRVSAGAAGEPAGAAAAGAGALFDGAGLLAELGGEAEDLAGVVALFLQDLEQELGRLREARRQWDFPLLRDAAHVLKGAAGNVFAMELSACAARLQGLAERHEEAAAAATLVTLEACAEQTRRQMTPWLGRVGDAATG
jgi:two-component system sensor histidine kinase/response regulator